MKLEKDCKNRILGNREHTCRICGASGAFASYLVREMMRGTRDEFEYFVCDGCGCLQLADLPDDLGLYYGPDYYSYAVQNDIDKKLESPVQHDEYILDVGCGSGEWLLSMAAQGYGNLYGVDPYLDKNITYGDRVFIQNCSIEEFLSEISFDYITMFDSFEHTDNPLGMLKSAGKLLKSDGVLIMTLPTFPNIAFDMFGPHWYQLDAPRHIMLHSRKSLKYIADRAGLRIAGIRYNSANSQFIKSFFYERGVSYFEITPELINECFSAENILKLQKMSEEYNAKGYGDHMEVYMEVG